tara:strand:- start:179 stop:481 length:303 start_codon:yes stop_codon:yes gene_type:complete
MPTPKKNDPLTHEEMSSAASHFQELYDVVAVKFPDASVEDVLKIMESCAKYAHKERTDKIKAVEDARFGFRKIENPDEDEKKVEMMFGSEYEKGINYEDN